MAHESYWFFRFSYSIQVRSMNSIGKVFATLFLVLYWMLKSKHIILNKIFGCRVVPNVVSKIIETTLIYENYEHIIENIIFSINMKRKIFTNSYLYGSWTC